MEAPPLRASAPISAALCARKMEYLEPTKNSTIRLLILVVVVVMIGPALNYLWSIYSSWTDTLPLCDSIIWLERGIYFIGLAFILLSIWWLKTPYLVFKYKQFPYPGTTVYKRTKIRKGKTAYLCAFVFTIYGLIIAGSGIAIVYGFELVKDSGVQECT